MRNLTVLVVAFVLGCSSGGADFFDGGLDMEPKIESPTTSVKLVFSAAASYCQLSAPVRSFNSDGVSLSFYGDELFKYCSHIVGGNSCTMGSSAMIPIKVLGWKKTRLVVEQTYRGVASFGDEGFVITRNFIAIFDIVQRNEVFTTTFTGSSKGLMHSEYVFSTEGADTLMTNFFTRLECNYAINEYWRWTLYDVRLEKVE